MERESKCYVRKSWWLYLINCIIYTTISFCFILGMSGIFGQNAYAKATSASSSKKVKIDKGDEWRYFKGKQEPPDGWYHIGFDDSDWQKGRSGFGYGKGNGNGKGSESGSNITNLEDMKGSYSSFYVRRDFIVDDVHAVTNMTISIDCDGPFIVYLDGIEIIRNESGLKDELLDVSGFIHELFSGENILAIECSNDDINSDEFSFTPYFELTERQDK
ncbi:hypothetical protein [Candidatus Kuenenia stuttgartiensis]|uniref:Uncharacterized protein n=1 Tax=Kuenenia stuttgartiensis TaxID=174633 RepID=A0A2C9CBF5_KUEST|nr:hypothetical protein [Candidatus Kuenenia stuttgartiensis]SOH03036.1 hypothetical protein KSMBR1_0522 [Candidatus Kuenenia stuttgartiensis]